jgi:hypothetical protein
MLDEDTSPDSNYPSSLGQLWPYAAAAGALLVVGVAAFLAWRTWPPGGFAPKGAAAAQASETDATAPGSAESPAATPVAFINSEECAELAGYMICNQVHDDTQRKSAAIYGWWPEEGWVNEAGAELVEGAAPRLLHGFTLALDLEGVLHVRAVSPRPAPTPLPPPEPLPDEWGLPSLVAG